VINNSLRVLFIINFFTVTYKIQVTFFFLLNRHKMRMRNGPRPASETWPKTNITRS